MDVTLSNVVTMAVALVVLAAFWAVFAGTEIMTTRALRAVRRRAARPRQVSLVTAQVQNLPDRAPDGHRFAAHVVVENASPHPVTDVHVVRAVAYLTDKVPLDWHEPVLAAGSTASRRFERQESFPATYDYVVQFRFTDADGRRWKRKGHGDPRRILRPGRLGRRPAPRSP